VTREISVTEGELRLIRLLASRGGRAEVDKIPMEKSSALALASLLEDKGLVLVERRAKRVLRLTDRGKDAVSKGLPEERLLDLLRASGGSAPLARVRESGLFADKAELDAALGEARRAGWISFKKLDGETVVELVSAPERSPLGEALRSIAAGVGEVPAEIASRLRSRGLVEEDEVAEFTLALTPLGLEVAHGNVPVVMEVAKLNRGLIESGTWRSVRLKAYDVTLPPPTVYPGKSHPYVQFLEEVREILIGMGFEEVKSPIVEAEFWNFDVLFQAQDHPAREVHDSYTLAYPATAPVPPDPELVERVRRTHEDGWVTGSRGWGYRWSFETAMRLMLRSQTTSASARTLASRKDLPLKIFVIDRVFRPEALDRTHSMEFHQCEGVVLAEGLNVRHLLGYLKEFANKLGFEEVAFRPAYFPFTEPSVEAYVKHSEMGWIEIAGSGLFRPEVMIPLGYDYPRVQALAWGIGIGRLAMVRLGLDDIRDLHSQDLQFLREFPARW